MFIYIYVRFCVCKLSTSGCVIVYDRWIDTSIIFELGMYGAVCDELTECFFGFI